MPGSRPTRGLPPGGHVGATGPRLLAALVEVGPIWLLVGLALLFGFVVDGRTLIAVLFVLLAVAWAILVWRQRVTRAAGPGMRLDSLQIVGSGDGQPIGWARVLLRWLVFAGLTVSVVGLIALAVAMARHPYRQGWHDLAADAVVIRERPVTPPWPRSTGVQMSEAHVDPARVETAPPMSLLGSPSLTTSIVGDQQGDRSDLEWWLRLDDGRDVGVDGLVLLGRNPQPRVGEEDATLIKVIDKARTVSKSHLAVGVVAGGLYVIDRGSTNGTTVTVPDGGQRHCPPGDLIDVPVGSVISYGDRWLEVRRPGNQEIEVPAGRTR